MFLQNATIYNTSSRRVNTAYSRSRGRGRSRAPNRGRGRGRGYGQTEHSISPQRSLHTSSEISNSTIHILEQSTTSPPNLEDNQTSNSTSRENRVHILYENVSHDERDRAISQDISILNSSKIFFT